MGPLKTAVPATLVLNVKFLAIRLVGVVIHVIPFRAAFLNGLGSVIGLFIMFLRIGQWRAIKRFAQHTGSALPALLYITKYFIQQGKDGAWGYVLCEAPSVLDQYVTTRNVEAVKHALAGGKGVIVLGAHYGPALYAYMLNRIYSDVKVLYSKEFVMQLHDAWDLVLKPLRSKKVVLLNGPEVVLVSQKDEKRLVEHIKKGGMVGTHVDFPGPAGKVGTTPFLGISICPHAFPFQVALKYDVPVFFCFFRKAEHGAYTMDFIFSGTFATPDEGFRIYLSRLQAEIEEYPFMWSAIPHFFEWS
jgi:predicted LPLAT superfamily acyltransferase